MAGTIRVSTLRKIGVPGVGDVAATFGTLTAGHLTVSGKTLALTKTRPITRGHLTTHGKSQTWLSTAWQYITITSIGSIGVLRTLYDSLDPAFSLTPSVGDVWRVPTLSQDGGTITVAVDGRFEIGAPTSGFDVMPAVLYYNLINQQWYGPADFTILDAPLTLPIGRGHLSLQGKQLQMARTRLVVPGHLVVFGHQVALRRLYSITQGHLTLTGKPTQLNRQMAIQRGHLTLAGKTITLAARLTLSIVPGHLTQSGKTLKLNRSIAIAPGHLTLAGKDVDIGVGLPLFMDPGNLQVDGKVMRLDKILMFNPGHLVVNGKTLTLTQPERRLEYASPVRMTDVSDEYRFQ